MFGEIEHKEVISIVSRYDTAHRPLKVFDSEYTPYVLKFPNNPFDDSSIIKEFLCHFLLKCWEIPTTKIASLHVPSNVIDQSSQITKREKELIRNYPCFGSKLLLHSTELSNLITADNIVSQRRIKNANDILKIALFDIWVENDDRKPSNNNILLNQAGRCFELIPIDHSYTFSSLEFSELTYTEVCFSDNDSILYSPLAKSIIKNIKCNREFYVEYEKMFYICIENVKALFSRPTSNVADNLIFTTRDKTFLSNFLFNNERNRSVLNNFFHIINSIKK